jgi:hypothetical protein
VLTNNMIIKNKLKILFLFIICSFFLPSCNISSNKDINVSNSNKDLIFDLGAKNGSYLSVKINYNQNKSLKENPVSFNSEVEIEKKNFSIKNSINGFSGKRANIKLLRIYLVDSNSSDLVLANIKEGPFDIDITSVGSLGTFFTDLTGTSGSSSTGNLIFQNVKPGIYYIAISAYNSTTTIDSSQNLTNISSPSSINSRNITSLGRFALSDTGGDLISLGSVKISSMVRSGKAVYGLANNGITALGVTLNLIDVFGATIDSNTTITDGSYTIPATTLN